MMAGPVKAGLVFGTRLAYYRAMKSIELNNGVTRHGRRTLHEMEVDMRSMTTLLLTLLLAGTTWLTVGCGTQNQGNNEEAIRTLLGTSEYTDDNQSGASDDESSEPRRDGFEPRDVLGLDYELAETLPWVRFARRIDRPIARSIIITIPAYPGYPETTALAVITASPTGSFYVHNDRGSHVAWVKDIADEGVRKVYLTQHDDTWRIRQMTPWDMRTKNAPYGINIKSVVIQARPSGLSYEYTTPDTMLTKRELPAFLPNDTVKVTVHVESDSAAWAFLHRGKRGHHVRRAFFQSSPNVFEREWIIPDDSISQRPAVRPTAIDILGWPTLFGDSLAPYNSRAWTLPYVVLDDPNSERPE